MSCSLHKPSPIDVGQNSEPAVVSSGGYYEDSIKDSKQGIVSVDHPIDDSEIKRLQGNCETGNFFNNICINYDDVKLSDWAFQGLQNLVERYGVIQAYSDKTFRGDRAATRYEVADMLAAAMDVIDREIKQQARESFSKKSFI
ncbi:MAG: S-layer homology domain-containing protein [Stenomitos rutilans HA7619-LM2]|nr:S-layer homology domain-containing protein [Stenomitos rutilans HA7619-LM2]